MNNFADILDHIADSLDPDELIERLGLSSRELCDKLADEIEMKLEAFEDVYFSEEEEYE